MSPGYTRLLPPAPQRRASFLRRLLLTSAVCFLPSVPLAPGSAPASETPPGPCYISASSSDQSSPWCTLVSVLEAYGGGPCKPEIFAAGAAVRYATIPEGCCTVSVDQQAVCALRLMPRSGVSAALAAQADCIPWVAHIRGAIAGGTGVAITSTTVIAFPGSGGVYGAGSSSRNFRYDMTGCEPVTGASMAAGTAQVLASGSASISIGGSASACNWDPIGWSNGYQCVSDPFVEIDPSWPYAADYMVQKETSPGSGVWVEMQRDTVDVPFTDVAQGPLADSAVTAASVWGDYDGDGRPDLYVARWNLPAHLFHNLGDGTFADVTTPALAVSGSVVDATWVDFDNDGDPDLFITRTNSQPDVLLRNDGAGVFVAATPPALAYAGTSWGVEWIDYDRDGDLDCSFASWYAGAKLIRNDGGGGFTDVTPSAWKVPSYVTAIAWCDFDNDGDPDPLLVKGYGSTCQLYRNDGGGVFTDVTGATGPIGSITQGWACSWTDYDNDGWFDLYVTTRAGERNRLFHNDHGIFADSTGSWTGDLGYDAANGWGDIDADGDPDLYVCSKTGATSDVTGSNFFVVNYGDHFGNPFWHVGGPVSEPGWAMTMAFADYDGDGDLDLFSGNSAVNRLLRNDQALGHHWLEVDLAGVTSNRFGVGSRIRVVTGERSQRRDVHASSGFGNGSWLTAHFGLDSVAVVDTVEVRWPSGTLTTFAGPFTADRRIRVYETGQVTGVADAPALTAHPTLHGCYPNPLAGATTVRFSLPTPASVRLAIYDIAGRRIRTLCDGQVAPAGLSSVVWDGTADDGRQLPAGVYLCRLTTPGSESARGVVVKMVKRR